MWCLTRRKINIRFTAAQRLGTLMPLFGDHSTCPSLPPLFHVHVRKASTFDHSFDHGGRSMNRRRFVSAMTLASGALLAAPGSATAVGQSHDPEKERERPDAPRPNFFPGFQTRDLKTSSVQIHFVVGGSGPPVLLLHGYPQTHIIWRKIAPALARDFTIVAPDLRGYGDSGKPADGENHSGYSKRAMAQDQVEVMEQLGFKRFAVVGHDRGGRVAHAWPSIIHSQ
jgi:hypothetical protein